MRRKAVRGEGRKDIYGPKCLEGGIEQHTDIQIRALLTHTYIHTCRELLSLICIT